MDELIRRGRALRAALGASDRDPSTLAETRIWQHDCEAAVRQLSGGSKTHWVSRAYSDALLVRTTAGHAAEVADLAVIVDRMLDVLHRAAEALAGSGPVRAAEPGGDAPPNRFEFVHDAALRPVLAEAYAEGRQALARGHYEDALMAFCGTLEAALTDALVHRHPEVKDEIARMSFDARIAAAERARLIRNGCARLPAVARAYRDAAANVAVHEADARTTSQVLRTVMRDLDPGR